MAEQQQCLDNRKSLHEKGTKTEVNNGIELKTDRGLKGQMEAIAPHAEGSTVDRMM